MKMKTRNPIAAAALLSMLAIGAASCGKETVWRTEARNITVDIPARLYAPTDAEPELRGAGAESVSITVTAEVDGVETPFTANIRADGLPPGGAFGSVSLPMDGKLVSVAASFSAGGNVIASAEITDADDMDAERYGGFTGFPDLTAFKLSWQPTDSPSGSFRLLPCPRPNADITCDSGLELVPFKHATDHPLVLAMQVAIQLTAQEYAAGGDITYDIYYALANEDLSRYSAANFSGSYLAYPWSSRWTYDEVVGGTGKRVNDTTYTLTPMQRDLVAGQLIDAHYAVLLDFSGVEGAAAGKWAVFCLVLHRAGLSATCDAFCVELK